MELFLLIATGIFFVAGVLLLLSPKTVEKISRTTNKVLFSLDDKIPVMRRPLGIIFLAVTIYLWYVLLHKIYK